MRILARATNRDPARVPAVAITARWAAPPAVITMSDLDRPAGLAMVLWTEQGRGWAYVCDPVGHAIDVIDQDARPMFSFGAYGDRPGQFNQPSDVVVLPADPWLRSVTSGPAVVAVADRGNHRVQLFEPDGLLLAVMAPRVPVRSLEDEASVRFLEIELDGLVHPTRLAWKGSWLEITNYDQSGVRVDLADALQGAAASARHHLTRAVRQVLPQRRPSESRALHAVVRRQPAAGRWS